MSAAIASLLSLFLLCACPIPFLWWQFHRHEQAKIFLVRDAFSAAECEVVLRIVTDASLNLWDNIEESQHYLPTKEIRVSESPQLLNATREPVKRMLGHLRRLYHVQDDMELADLYVVRYDKEGVSGLQMHVDAYTLSFSLALSPPTAYEGGGLEFDLLGGEPLREAFGTVVTFPSKLLHRGVDVVSGARYALIGLVAVGGDEVWDYGDDEHVSKIHGMWTHAHTSRSPGPAERASAPVRGQISRALRRPLHRARRCLSVYELDGAPERLEGMGALILGDVEARATELSRECHASRAELTWRHVYNRAEILWRKGNMDDLKEVLLLNLAIVVGALGLRSAAL